MLFLSGLTGKGVMSYVLRPDKLTDTYIYTHMPKGLTGLELALKFPSVSITLFFFQSPLLVLGSDVREEGKNQIK